MDLKDIMSITGLPGLYKVLARRNDGLIVSGLHDNARKFVPARQHMFTPLENITIYTIDDSAELKTVLANMKASAGTLPSAKDDDSKLRDFMKKVLPNYDEEKVYTSDIRKLLKWYDLLDKHNLLTADEESPAAEESAEEKPKAKKKVAPPEATEESAAEDKPKKAAKPKAAKSADADTEDKPKKKAAKKSE